MDIDKYSTELFLYNKNRSKFWDDIYGQKNILSYYYRERVNTVYKNFIPPNLNILDVGSGDGNLLNFLCPKYGIGIDFSINSIKSATLKYPNLTFFVQDSHNLKLNNTNFDYIVASELVNDIWDVQIFFEKLHLVTNPNTRVAINFCSHLWMPFLKMLRFFRLIRPALDQNWLTKSDLKNLFEISGFEVIRSWEEILIPISIPFVSNFFNKYLVKIPPFKHFAFMNFMIARPIFPAQHAIPSSSVVIAARNEAGHINELLSRIPQLDPLMEIIIVEGNSSDDTFNVIQDYINLNPQRNIKLIKQIGKGKGDAVRLGFKAASGDILLILDADITVPPEELTRFYSLLKSGQAEFVNGVRLVYPMEGNAMQFANLLGNKFFSWAFTWLLGQPIRDTLCGTKVLWRSHYMRIEENRLRFGDFDPFGDFDLLFGAAYLNLKLMEVPVRYRARVYGETNISRWKHGLLLLKMVSFAAKKIKFI